VQIPESYKYTSTSNSISNSTRNNIVIDTSTSQRQQVKRIADYLESILEPRDNCSPLFMKFAWMYPEATLIKLATEARETDKQGSPTRLFVFLVKKELGYTAKI